MPAKKIYLVPIGCAMVAIVLFAAGCGERKDSLNLPAGEMKQLENNKMVSSETKKVFKAEENGQARKGNVFHVYVDRGYFKNHFIPSGWMGDYGDLKINESWRENPYSRRHCIRIDYSGRIAQGAGWAGMYWQEPQNNWGNIPGGYDITGAEKLTFYARGEKGGEVITEFKIGGIQGEFSDSTSVSIGPIVLTPEWKKYTITLENEDLSHVIAGFAFVISQMENPDGAVFYLDDVKYE